MIKRHLTMSEKSILINENNSLKLQRNLCIIALIFIVFILILHRISTPFKMFFSIYDFHRIKWDCGIFLYYVNEPILT